MPLNHQQYVQWKGDRFRKWAAKIGVNTNLIIGALLSGYKVEQLGYKVCMDILKLADKYSNELLCIAWTFLFIILEIKLTTIIGTCSNNNILFLQSLNMRSIVDVGIPVGADIFGYRNRWIITNYT